MIKAKLRHTTVGYREHDDAKREPPTRLGACFDERTLSTAAIRTSRFRNGNTINPSTIESVEIVGHTWHGAECRMCTRLFADSDELTVTLVGV